jgi:hypothetical protein
MKRFSKRPAPCIVRASAILLLGLILPFAHAQEQDSAQKPEEPSAKEKSAGGATAQGQEFDPAVVRAGMTAFERSCTNCHDGARALERSNNLAGWRATVRRMAGKRGAEVASGDVEPIAVYLASRMAPAEAAATPKRLLDPLLTLVGAKEQAAEQKPEEQPAKEKPAGGSSAQGQKFDPAVVSAGQAAFEQSCTKCHDAARSLERTKDLAGWRATVKRMAGKRGAEVASGDIEPIAVYLASRTAPGAAATPETAGTPSEVTKTAAAAAPAAEASSLSAFATLSPQWRGGNNHVENPDFGPLAWVGATWQGKLLSARVTACIACHGVAEPGLISRIEPVEVAVRLDLSEFLDHHVCHGMKGNIDAGRFIIPFGAFSALVDPSLYRTVSPPLIFNMGQRIFNQDLGFPVLPMPFADEGVNLDLSVPLGDCGTGPITATLDGYLNNGLEGNTNGVDFLQSRDLWDNNVRPAGGGRLTVGDPYVRAGTSLTGGRFDDPNSSGVRQGLYYMIYGFDVRAQYHRLFRAQFEWARRDNDRVGVFPAGPAVFSESVFGYYVEAEARPCDKSRVSAVARYDWQAKQSLIASGTLPSGDFTVKRLTLGINIELWQQSLLLVNYERWYLPEPGHPTADVFGVRYTITF